MLNTHVEHVAAVKIQSAFRGMVQRGQRTLQKPGKLLQTMCTSTARRGIRDARRVTAATRQAVLQGAARLRELDILFWLRTLLENLAAFVCALISLAQPAIFSLPYLLIFMAYVHVELHFTRRRQLLERAIDKLAGYTAMLDLLLIYVARVSFFQPWFESVGERMQATGWAGSSSVVHEGTVTLRLLIIAAMAVQTLVQNKHDAGHEPKHHIAAGVNSSGGGDSGRGTGRHRPQSAAVTPRDLEAPLAQQAMVDSIAQPGSSKTKTKSSSRFLKGFLLWGCCSVLNMAYVCTLVFWSVFHVSPSSWLTLAMATWHSVLHRQAGLSARSHTQQLAVHYRYTTLHILLLQAVQVRPRGAM